MKEGEEEEEQILRSIVDDFEPCLFGASRWTCCRNFLMLRNDIVPGGCVLDWCGCSSDHGD